MTAQRHPTGHGEGNDLFAGLGKWCVRHRRSIVIVWAVVFAVLGSMAPRLGDELTSGGFEIRGSDSQRVPQITRSKFSAEYASGLSAVIETRPDTSDAAAAIRAATDRVRRVALRYPDLVRAVDPVRIAPNGKTGVVLIGLHRTLDEVLRKADPILNDLAATTGQGTDIRITGGAAVFRDFDAVNERDLRRSELIQMPLVLAILLFVVGSVLAAGLPILASAVAMITTLGALWFAARSIDLTIYVKNIVPLIGIGVSVDYSLFIVTRFREELAEGYDVPDAVVRTSATAGRAVFFSGLTVIVALAGMAAVRVPIFTAFAVGATTVVGAAMATALTLVPALLALLGRRLAPARSTRALLGAASSGRMERFAERVMRTPARSLALGTAVLLVLAAPVTVMRLGSSGSSAIPKSMPSIRAAQTIAEIASPGAVAPIRIVIDGHGTPPRLALVTALAREVQRDPAVIATTAPRRSDDGTFMVFETIAAFHEDDHRSHELVRRLRESVLPAALGSSGDAAYVGGAPAQNADFIDTVSGRLPLVIALVMLLTFIVLTILFRSIILPLKAIVITLLSAVASYGVLVAVFQWGWLSGLLGFQSLGHVTAWVPPFLFCLLFGLSMDYEVFLITRIRERLDTTDDQRAAIAWGIGRSGRIITAAALIMVVVFLSFVTNRLIPVKEAALGMAVAVILDATIVRMVLVPSFMALAGRWNWWLPRWLDRLLAGRSPAGSA